MGEYGICHLFFGGMLVNRVFIFLGDRMILVGMLCFQSFGGILIGAKSMILIGLAFLYLSFRFRMHIRFLAQLLHKYIFQELISLLFESSIFRCFGPINLM